MNFLKRIHFRRLIHAAAMILLAVVSVGCIKTFRTIDPRFAKNPNGYRRVQVLPIWLDAAGNLDRTLKTNELNELCWRAGENLSETLKKNLRAKGYEVVGPVQTVSRRDSSSSSVDAEIELEQLRNDFRKLLLKFPSKSGKNTSLTFQVLEKPSPIFPNPEAQPPKNAFHYTIGFPMDHLLEVLGATNVEAVLLIDAKAFFESPRHNTKRTVWNWSGAGLVAVTEIGVDGALCAATFLAGSTSPPPFLWVNPLWHSSNSIEYDIALVDRRTQDVLWLNARKFRTVDPRLPETTAETIKETLTDLPVVYLK